MENRNIRKRLFETSVVKISSTASPSASQQGHFLKRSDCTAVAYILKSVACST